MKGTAPIEKWVELYWPLSTAGAAGACAFFLERHIHLPIEVQAKLVDKLIDLCAITIGFWSTALALLLALDGRKTIQGLKQIDLYDRIVNYFLRTVYAYFLVLLASFLTIALGHPSWASHRLYVVFWAFIVSWAACTVLRSFFVLGKLLKTP